MVRNAVLWLFQHSAELGVDPGRIFLSGSPDSPRPRPCSTADRRLRRQRDGCLRRPAPTVRVLPGPVGDVRGRSGGARPEPLRPPAHPRGRGGTARPGYPRPDGPASATGGCGDRGMTTGT
jgi:hypothetical protein